MPELAGSTWSGLTSEAMDEWNSYMLGAQLSMHVGTGSTASAGNGVNELHFAETVFGFEFRDAIGLATTEYESGRIVESDIAFRSTYPWNIPEFRAVALHELGHTLGLGHPDEAGQEVSAIMNSILDGPLCLTDDDIDGIVSLYGGRPRAPVFIEEPLANPAANVGSVLTLEAHVRGFPRPNLQWEKDGVPIPGATSARFSVPSVGTGDVGSYRLIATNSEGTTISATIELKVGESVGKVYYLHSANAIEVAGHEGVGGDLVIPDGFDVTIVSEGTASHFSDRSGRSPVPRFAPIADSQAFDCRRG